MLVKSRTGSPERVPGTATFEITLTAGQSGERPRRSSLRRSRIHEESRDTPSAPYRSGPGRPRSARPPGPFPPGVRSGRRCGSGCTIAEAGLDHPLVRRVRLRTDLELDSAREVAFLAPAAWRRPREPVDDAPPPSAAPDDEEWHQACGCDAEALGDRFARRRHLDRLVAARPGDGLLHARRARARPSGEDGESARADLERSRWSQATAFSTASAGGAVAPGRSRASPARRFAATSRSR